MVKINNLLLAILVVFAIIFTGCSSEKVQDTTKTNAIMQKENATKSESQVQQEKLTLAITDGLYSQDVTYSSPGGSEEFKLTLEVKQNKVEKVSIEPIAATNIGKMKINQVNGELQTLMVGKSVSEIKIPEVIISGASLTSKAFNEKLNELNK